MKKNIGPKLALYPVPITVIGSAVSVFLKNRIHDLFRSIASRKLGVFGTVIASALGIASPL